MKAYVMTRIMPFSQFDVPSFMAVTVNKTARKRVKASNISKLRSRSSPMDQPRSTVTGITNTAICVELPAKIQSNSYCKPSFTTFCLCSSSIEIAGSTLGFLVDQQDMQENLTNCNTQCNFHSVLECEKDGRCMLSSIANNRKNYC